jgi:hypothetical protein
MTKPMVRIHNTETDEIIDREMNAAEFAQYKAQQVQAEAQAIELELKATAKTELLNRLGITAEEAQLLLS